MEKIGLKLILILLYLTFLIVNINVQLPAVLSNSITSMHLMNHKPLSQPNIVLNKISIATIAETSQDISNCGTLSTSNQIYVLKNDVSSSGTCFTIDGNNISLDLNGHTVTYGTSLQNASNEYEYAGIKNYRYNRRNIKIYNGKIVQATNGGKISPAVWINAPNTEVRNLNIDVNGGDASGIFCDFCPTGVDIHHNEINNTSTLVDWRHNVQASINAPRSYGNLKIYDNKITGGPQAGIFVSTYNQANNQGYKIYNNHISHDERYSNGFGIHLYGSWFDDVSNETGETAEIYNNTITPNYGRGIGIELSPQGSDIKVYQNTIDSKSRNKSLQAGNIIEYDPYWVYGIKIEDSYGVSVYQNNVKVRANSTTGHAYAIDVTLPTNSNTKIYSNTFEAVTTISSKNACVLRPTQSESENKARISNNRFVSNNKIIYIDANGGFGTNYESNTFVKGINPIDFRILYFANTDYGAGDYIFIDPKFENGATFSNTYFSSNIQTANFKVKWYLNIEIKDKNVDPISGVTVLSNKESTPWLTDANGRARLELSEYERTKTNITYFNPHQITLSKSGYTTVTLIENISTSISKTVLMDSGIIIIKTADKTNISSEQIIKFNITYINGYEPISDFVLQDPLPNELTPVVGTVTGGGTISGNIVTWNIGNLTDGASGSVAFDARAN